MTVSRIASSLALAFLFATPLAAQSSKRQVIVPPGTTPNPTLSAAIRVGDMVFASGQLGLKRDAPDSTIQGQTRVALDATKKVLEAAGTTMGNVVKCTVFLTDVKDFGGMNSVYREFFPENPPTRSTVVVAALVSAGAKVEIECMAAMP